MLHCATRIAAGNFVASSFRALVIKTHSAIHGEVSDRKGSASFSARSTSPDSSAESIASSLCFISPECASAAARNSFSLLDGNHRPFSITPAMLFVLLIFSSGFANSNTRSASAPFVIVPKRGASGHVLRDELTRIPGCSKQCLVWRKSGFHQLLQFLMG